jgi:hypothetical protein
MSDILVPVQVVLKLFTMANELLSYWVVGNTLVDPGGETLIESLAVIIERSTRVFAWFWSIV